MSSQRWSLLRTAGASASLVVCCFMVFARADVKTRYTISPPFDKHDHKGSRIIPYWDKQGSTSITQSFVRLTPDKPDQTGTLWTRSPLDAPDFSLEWKFRISGSEPVQFGDTLSLVISNSKYQAGDFYGYREDFTGIMVVINTNRKVGTSRRAEPMGRRKDVAVVANNGTRNAADLMANVEGCNANVRFDERRDDFSVMQATRVRLKLFGDTASMEVDARNSGRWRRCATLMHLDMPKDWATSAFVGMVAETSKATNNQDLLTFRLYSDPQEAWEIDTYEEDDEDDYDSLVHHMEHELFSVHDTLQETIEQLQKAEEVAENRLEELEASLNRNVMEALESRVAKLEVQVQTSVSKTLNRRVSQVYDQLEQDVGGKLTAHVGKMSGGWRWPFFGLLAVVGGMVGMSFTKYKQLKKQHLL